MFNERREKIICAAQSFLGCEEENGSHKRIVDIYNQYKPLPRGYTVRYDDYWCATFISAVAIVADCSEIIPIECSCSKMISLCKEMGIWQENDSYIPNVGDIIFYDWQDSGEGDCMGYPEHVGYVVEVVDNNILVIEGNFNRQVNYRTIKVDGLYIRGYAAPRYEEVIEQNEFTTNHYVVKEGDTLSNIALMFQKSVESLVKYNKIADPNKIHVGSILQIPQDIKAYIVKKGDCLSSIARIFHTTVDKLKNDNNIVNPDLIYVGQEIKIY